MEMEHRIKLLRDDRTISKQLRLFDIRLRQTETHSFGWKQESSETQSALINQAWSPDGLYVSSGSVDPMIHIFDIRYNGNSPSQPVQAHQKRVFKAIWHQSHPLMTTISSDLNIGCIRFPCKRSVRVVLKILSCRQHDTLEDFILEIVIEHILIQGLEFHPLYILRTAPKDLLMNLFVDTTNNF